MKDFISSLIQIIKFIKLKKEKKKFVFFSESKFYIYHFESLIDELLKLNQSDIYYLCLDKKDYNFYKKKINCIFISNKFFLQIIFSTLECKYLILTLTGLGSNLVKSKKCDKFIYFFHALASTHKIYTKDAFKNYDIVFTNGNYQKIELEKAEKKYNFPPKKIINTGYFYLDYLIKNSKPNSKIKKTVLFAPSWNYNKKNLFDDYSIEIVKILIKNNFQVILRPHPEHFKRSKNILKQFLYLKNLDNFEIDEKNLNIESMEKAEILVTDNSAIIFEYVLCFKRPFINIEYTNKIHNENYKLLEIDTLEDNFINLFGNKIDINNLEKLPQLITMLSKDNKLDLNVEKFKQKYLSNIGFSAKIAADYLNNNINN